MLRRLLLLRQYLLRSQQVIWVDQIDEIDNAEMQLLPVNQKRPYRFIHSMTASVIRKLAAIPRRDTVGHE